MDPVFIETLLPLCLLTARDTATKKGLEKSIPPRIQRRVNERLMGS